MKFSIKRANEARKQKQDIAVRASHDHAFLFLEWFTGIGKSLAALRILKEHKGNWVIVVKELNHILTWEDEFKKWKIHRPKNLEIITYDSLHKLSKRKKYNLILDEAHGITALRLKKLKQLSIERVLGLSATMPAEKRTLLNKLSVFTYYTISMAKAIEEGIQPEPEIRVGYITLSEGQRAKYDGYTAAIWKAMEDNNEERAKYIGAARKRYLASCKTAYVIKYLDLSKRFVCFTGSIDQCDILGGENVVHSKTENRVETIAAFNDLKIDHLFAVNMLRESMNLRNIDVGYIIQLDNQEKSFIQMLGRSFRSTTPIVYVFICKNTVDEGYAKTAFSSIPKRYIQSKDI